MAELIADCPRCNADRVTFDALRSGPGRKQYQRESRYEVFCICRACSKSTVFVLDTREGGAGEKLLDVADLTKVTDSLNRYCTATAYISLKDGRVEDPPEHLPADIHAAFVEGATCMSVECFNAAATMFRLCLDFATRAALPADASGVNKQIRFSLGHRLQYLFDNGYLPEALRDLSSCVKEDGNDGAHEGSLQKPDAEDLHDFTVALLERLYTEPAKLAIAKERREARRNKSAP